MSDIHALHIIFDGPPSHESGRFVEVETPDGKGINAGEWVERDDGLWALVIPSRLAPPPAPAVPDESRVDEIVTRLYRRFKDWSKRGFGPDDVTWCEVKADVVAMLAAAGDSHHE